MVLTRPTQQAIIHDPGCHSFVYRCLREVGDTMYSHPAAKSAAGYRPGTGPSARTSPGGRKSQCTPGEYISGAGKSAAWPVQAWGDNKVNYSETSFCVFFLVYIVEIINVSLLFGMDIFNNKAGNHCQKVNIFL